uniref:Uncharacterized protein n=1 Tax=Opuntia streptacantha TaxID=393608 RepID=A0A7C8ZHE7_OPUST
MLIISCQYSLGKALTFCFTSFALISLKLICSSQKMKIRNVAVNLRPLPKIKRLVVGKGKQDQTNLSSYPKVLSEEGRRAQMYTALPVYCKEVVSISPYI